MSKGEWKSNIPKNNETFYAAHEAVFSLYKEAILTVQDNCKVF